MTAKAAHKVARPEYVCTLTDEQILDRMERRILKNASRGQLYAAFPEVWFRPAVGEDLMARGFIVEDEIYKSQFRTEPPQNYRRVSW